MKLLALALLLAAPPTEAEVQGLYEGAIGNGKAEVRVVALGKSAFKAFVRKTVDGKVEKCELAGKIEGDAASFQGAGLSASWSAGELKGDGVALKRVQRKPPSLGKAPPAGAVVLLDGKNWNEIRRGKAEDWKPADDGSVQVTPSGLSSARQFEGSFDLHVEFQSPLMPEARGQGRGNSGCYLPNGDEIQVLDSFGMDTYKGGGCGGLYGFKDPDAFDVFSLASLPPGEWQTYDVEYRVAAGKAKLTVLHNGTRIHDAVELPKAAKKGGFHFQDHGNPVRYRNIWVVPVP
jgi:hypothetical protein